MMLEGIGSFRLSYQIWCVEWLIGCLYLPYNVHEVRPDGFSSLMTSVIYVFSFICLI